MNDILVLAREAETTSDCDRQLELAEIASDVVRRALLKNENLCDELRERLERIRKRLDNFLDSAE